MENLKTAIINVISSKSSIDWLIVHDISKSYAKINDVEFSFVDGNERQDEPFNTNQGYISLKKDTSIKAFEEISVQLVERFKSEPIALANLFIVFTRTSYTGEDKQTLIKKYKRILGADVCKTVFALLIKSLNVEYYKHYYSSHKKPITLNQWLDLFRSAQYTHGFSDPILSCLQLVRIERNLSIEFEHIEGMAPLLRSVLISFYGCELVIPDAKFKDLINKEDELTFLSAYLLDETGRDAKVPDWLSQHLVELFIDKHWNKIGKDFFVHVFGLSYRNKNQNDLYKKLEEYADMVLSRKLYSESQETKIWIRQLEFPEHFIALFSCFSDTKTNYNSIPISNVQTILEQFIEELKRITKKLPEYLASENSADPFISYYLSEPKYVKTLAYLLLLLLRANDSNRKELSNACHEFKALFYGHFRACALAIYFTELLILIGLSGRYLTGIEEGEFVALRKYLIIISDTVLIPYVHLIERDDEVWNPESKKELFHHSAGGYMVREALTEIRKHEIFSHYQEFFKNIEDVKVAEWSYERNSI
jgi:hypothetical protein